MNFENQKPRSKIEKRLKDFRIYRISPSYKLLHLAPEISDWRQEALTKILSRAIFFTTQKEMALDYRDNSKSVLFEERGVDFLEDLKKIEDQGVKIVALTHKDIITYQKIND